jgi:hypothetical protein
MACVFKLGSDLWHHFCFGRGFKLLTRTEESCEGFGSSGTEQATTGTRRVHMPLGRERD